MNALSRRSAAHRALSAGQVRLVLLVAFLAALYAGVGLFHVATRVAVVRAGYDLSRVERTYRELLHEQEHLKMERATLRQAPRLEAIARTQLGMAPPSPAQLIVVSPPAHPKPATVQPGAVATALRTAPQR